MNVESGKSGKMRDPLILVLLSRFPHLLWLGFETTEIFFSSVPTSPQLSHPELTENMEIRKSGKGLSRWQFVPDFLISRFVLAWV